MNLRVINLEAGRPLAHVAVKNMNSELRRARVQRVDVVKLIHGYGSSGTGGRIREEVRKELRVKQRNGAIKGYVPGEEFSPFSPEGRAALSKYPDLARDDAYSRNNPGITFVLL